MNRWCGTGRLGKDPELRYTSEGTAVCNLSIAVRRRTKEDRVDWVQVTCWRQLAEVSSQYLRKGSLVGVTGALQSRKYTGQDGQPRIAWEIQADSLDFLSPREETNTAQQPPSQPTSVPEWPEGIENIPF